MPAIFSIVAMLQRLPRLSRPALLGRSLLHSFPVWLRCIRRNVRFGEAECRERNKRETRYTIASHGTRGTERSSRETATSESIQRGSTAVLLPEKSVVFRCFLNVKGPLLRRCQPRLRRTAFLSHFILTKGRATLSASVASGTIDNRGRSGVI